MNATAIVKEKTTVPVIALALAFGALTVLLEAAFQVPVKLPGHRAFPGAMALLLFCESFAPLLLMAFSLLIPSVLVLAGASSPLIIAAWLIPAGLMVLLSSKRFRQSVWFFLAFGLVFGLMRYLSLMFKPHHTPELLRLCGHLVFGGLAGLTASWTVKKLARRENMPS